MGKNWGEGLRGGKEDEKSQEWKDDVGGREVWEEEDGGYR